MAKVQEGNVTHCDKKQREETEVQNIKTASGPMMGCFNQERYPDRQHR